MNTCPWCLEDHSDQAALLVHAIIKHPEQNIDHYGNYWCPGCSGVFTFKEDLVRHLEGMGGMLAHVAEAVLIGRHKRKPRWPKTMQASTTLAPR